VTGSRRPISLQSSRPAFWAYTVLQGTGFSSIGGLGYALEMMRATRGGSRACDRASPRLQSGRVRSVSTSGSRRVGIKLCQRLLAVRYASPVAQTLKIFFQELEKSRLIVDQKQRLAHQSERGTFPGLNPRPNVGVARACTDDINCLIA